MASPQNITARQLTLARDAQWHRNGEPLQTTDAIREWIETSGLLPVYPLPQFQAPMPSFAEAVLGRPENGYIPKPKRSASADEGDLNGTEEDFDAEGDETEEDFVEDDDADSIEEDDQDFDDEDAEDADSDEEDRDDEDDQDDEDEDEPATGKGDEAMLSGDGNIPTDPETIVSNDDEFSEDEGDEIAEEDRIRAGDDPLPGDLIEGSTSTESPEEEPLPPAINGFTAEERETVHRALARLIEDGTVVPLNLLGNATGEPDYIVPASAFSFVYTLRGDKNWKNEPATTGAMRVSPLAVKVFTLLKEKGAQAPYELTQRLGQGVTDSATLRALNELWAIQRIIPLPDADGKPAKWELITHKFLRAMKAGANAGQPTALSALLSLYLNQTLAATSDDMEIFLSPLAARSRTREVVGGLSATRQLESIVLEGKTLLHIAGALPELPSDDTEQVAALPQRSRYEQDDRRAEIADRRERFGSREDSRPARRPFGDRGEGRGDRPGFSRGGDRPGFARKPFGERKPFGDRSASGNEGERERRPFQRREEGGDRRPFPPRGDRPGFPPRERGNFAPRGDRPGFQPRERNNFARPWDEERPRRTEGEGGERRPFTPRGDGERRPFAAREDRGERRPYTPRGDRGGFAPRGDREGFAPRDRGGFPPREGGERRPFTPRGDRPFVNREDRGGYAPRGDRGGFRPRGEGEGRPFPPRPFGGNREQGGEDRGERRPFAPREGGFAPRRPGFDRKPGGFGGPRKPFGDRDGGERRPFPPREGGESRPFPPRGDGERRPFAPREGGDRPSFNRDRGGFDRKPGGFGDRPRGDRPAFGGGNRPAFGGRPRFDREGGSGGGFPRREGGGSSFGGDRKRFSGEAGEGRPSFQSGAHSAGPGGAKFGGSGFGRDRGGKGGPGSFGKPGFKPSFKGPGSGPGRGGAPKRRPE